MSILKEFLKGRSLEPEQPFEEYYKAYQPPFDKFESRQIAWARHDLNGDGSNEFIFQFQHPGICGSGGCSTFIFRKRTDKWIEIADFAGGGEIETTDPVIDGWPRLFSHEVCLVWKGNKYRAHFNDPFEMGIEPERRR